MLELQRLLTRSPSSLPRRALVDVGAILRHAGESGASSPLPILLDAVRRSSRDVLFVVAPPSIPGIVDMDMLDLAEHVLVAARVAYIRSTAMSLAGMLRTSALPCDSVGVVTAGIEARHYELHVLDRVRSLLDAATGCVWTLDSVRAQLGEPATIVQLAAVMGAEPGERPPSGWAQRHREIVLTAITSRAPLPDGTPPMIVQTFAQRGARVLELQGTSGGLSVTATPLDPWLLAIPAASSTTYAVARVERIDEAFVLREVQLESQGVRASASGEANVKALLARTVASSPDRWFIPRALDLCAAMIDAGISLPTLVVDPALTAFSFNPSAPIDLPGVAPTSAVLPGRVRAWASDLTRETPAPASFGAFLDVLPDIDRELDHAAAQLGVQNLVEADLAKTLPVLARVERMGAWVGQPVGPGSWGALRGQIEQELVVAERHAQSLPGMVDVYRASADDLLYVLKVQIGKRLPSPHWHKSLASAQEFERFVERGDPDAAAADTARRLGRPGGILSWVRELEGASRLRGRSVPQSTGRWAYRDRPVQNVPKRSTYGRTIRTGLYGPPGEVLVSADQNGFEVRLLADLSRDSVLLHAAQQDDIHGALASLLSTPAKTVTRKQSKAAMLAIMYGQGRDAFWRARADMTIADAMDIYDRVVAQLAGVVAYQGRVEAAFRANGFVRTPGGWRVYPDARAISAAGSKRSVFNRVVQGLGADIQRWVLRRLAYVLPAAARIVTQAHDAIVVACPLPMALHVEGLLVTAMTTDVMANSGLLSVPVRLVAKVRMGVDWGDS